MYLKHIFYIKTCDILEILLSLVQFIKTLAIQQENKHHVPGLIKKKTRFLIFKFIMNFYYFYQRITYNITLEQLCNCLFSFELQKTESFTERLHNVLSSFY